MSNYKRNRDIRAAYMDWMGIDPNKQCIPITLTYKMKIGDKSNGVSLNTDRMVQNIRHVINCVNKWLYGNNVKQGAGLPRLLAVHERSYGQRPHTHLWIEVPRAVSRRLLEELFKWFWRKSAWGFWQVHIGTKAEDKWNQYILKNRQKPDGVADAVDVVNIHRSESPEPKLLRFMYSDRKCALAKRLLKGEIEIRRDLCHEGCASRMTVTVSQPVCG